MYGRGLQRGHIQFELGQDLARRQPRDTDVEPIIFCKCSLLAVSALRPDGGDGITDEDDGRVNTKARAAPGRTQKSEQRQEFLRAPLKLSWRACSRARLPSDRHRYFRSRHGGRGWNRTTNLSDRKS